MRKSINVKKYIKQTVRAYQKTAKLYDSIITSSQQVIIYPKIIKILTDPFKSLFEVKILDVGCGSGVLMQMLEESGAKCCGVDITPEFLKMARSRSLDVYQASMHQLPFHNESFDTVVSNYVLNYLPPEGQKLALQEKFRVLKPGGVMVFSYMHPFFMRANRHKNDKPYCVSVINNYFEPIKKETIEMFGQKFVLYLQDWPEIVNMIVESGFCLRKLIDAEVPKNLKKIVSKIKNKQAISFMQSFKYNPYGIFIVATKK